MWIITNNPENFEGATDGGAKVFSSTVLNTKADWVVKNFPDFKGRSFREILNTKRGKTAWVVGSGPSNHKVTGMTFEGDDVWAINRGIYPILKKPIFAPWKSSGRVDYFAAHDAATIAELRRLVPKATLVTQAGNVYSGLKPNLQGAVFIEAEADPSRWKNPERRPLYFNETTLGWVIHLVVLMGYARLNLIGCELSLGGYKNPHMDDTELKRQHVGVRERMLKMFSPEEEPKWRTREIDIVDYSKGELGKLPNVRVGEIYDVR